MFEKGGRRMHFMTTYQDELTNGHITEVNLRFTRGMDEDGEEVSPLSTKSKRPKIIDSPVEVILTYDVVKNQLRMEENIVGYPPPDYDYLGVCTPGQAKAITGRLLNLDCSQTNVVGAENTLKVQWRVLAKKNLRGEKKLSLKVKDKDGATDGFNNLGTWYSK